VTADPRVGTPARTRKPWSAGRIIKYFVWLGLAGVAIWVVRGKTDELAGASGYLEDLSWQWLALGVVTEAASIVAYAALQRRLLAAGRVPVGLVPLTGITLAGNAIENSLPGGVAFSAIWAFRQFRYRGADDVLATWTLVAQTGLSQVALVLLAAAGLGISNSNGSALDLVRVILGMVVIAAAIVAAWSQRGRILPYTAGPLRLTQRLFHWPHGDPRAMIAYAIDRMESVTPSHRDWLVSGAMALANWVFDLACLATAFLAVHSEVPWRGLVLAYGAAQLAANLPVTPGGLGVVEGSLTIALVAYGGAEASTVAAVLLYRMISYWALLPAGWLAWGALSFASRRGGPLEAAPGPVKATPVEAVPVEAVPVEERQP
jgi:uncharacterized protein (TIRG00374 family)